ncbi:hypothetical protein [Guptibacillus hwajinpoensis]|uniref:Uncharacterized protein n=1 Tax=Guptibacillus hwajinpoensis TaxID=208199 RepID=A0ABU0JVD4_9BACL|nr:hypothetical protein [Alkalihalobacillus hemicentroti]MDQ0481071.1 hypothetical protein [Alkalihalobacillus hemicentroti]
MKAKDECTITSWADYLRTISHIINVIKMTEDYSYLQPEFVRNDTDNVLLFCVQMKDSNMMEVVALDKGQSMMDVADFHRIKDVEGIINDTGEITKLTGIAHALFQKQNWVTDVLCEWRISKKDPGLVDENCRIINREDFIKKHPEWERCFERIPPDKKVEFEPSCGDYGFDRCEPDDIGTDHRGGGGNGSSGSDLNSIIGPIELPGGLFQVGYESLTHYIVSPNFEGVSPAGWHYPINHYNRLGYDGQSHGYYGQHIMDCHYIEGSGPAPHGIYQNLNVLISGKIRFGVHVNRRNGPEDAEICIAIWSLNKHKSISKKYRVPVGSWFDCYVDAEVDQEDRLRIEIYLPEEGISYHLGGAYIIRQIRNKN